MQRYVIERELAGAGALTTHQLQDISTKSNEVLAEMDGVSWVESYVTDDKIYCVYEAEDAALIAEHARRGGFPANVIAPVKNVISPATGR